MTIEQKEKSLAAEEQERQQYNTLYWAGVLIWTGLVFVLESMDALPQIGQASTWSWVFFGAGLYALLGDLWRSASPSRLDPTTGDYVWAVVLMIIGVGGLTELDITWPLILIVLGGVLLFNTLWRRD